MTVKSMTTGIKSVIKGMFRSVYTTLPGRVEEYDKDTQTAKVKPLISRHYLDAKRLDHDYEEYPVIPNVPVIFPASDAGGMTFPLSAGDRVWILVSAPPLSEWLQQTLPRVINPFSRRRFDLSDSVCLPGPRPPGDALEADKVHDEDVTIYSESGRLRVGSSAAEHLLVRVDKLQAQLQDLKQAYDAHSHSYTQPATDSEGGTTSTGSPDTTFTVSEDLNSETVYVDN